MTHADKTRARVESAPAPRDIEWTDFISMWEHIADDVKNESGDRLSVTMNGHRVVFHRPHDGRVGIEDVERARHLLKATPDLKGSGSLLAVTIDERSSEIFAFDLDAVDVEDTTKKVRDHDPRGHHMRTVERHTGHDDEADLEHYFDLIATTLDEVAPGRSFVVLGHGHGKSDAAQGFVERLRKEHPQRAAQIIAVGDIDLSAVDAGDIENAAMKLAGR